MFWQIGGFILLTLFAFGVAGGCIVGYRALSVIGGKGKLEATKVKIEQENLDHSLRVIQHEHGQKVLQLMEGDSTRAVPKDKPAPSEDEPELVKGEVGLNPMDHQEYVDNLRNKREAEDAEYREVHSL